MVLPLVVGGALLGGGMLANFMGNSKRADAMAEVQQDYMNLLGRRTDQETARRTGDINREYGYAHEDTGNTLQDFERFAALPVPAESSGFLSNLRNNMAPAQAQFPQTPSGMSGRWGAAAQAQAAPDQARMLSGLSRQWADRQSANDRDAITVERRIADLARNRNRLNARERAQLDKMIADLGFQRDQMALQAAMQNAQQKGGTENAIGGLLGGLSGLAFL